MRIKITADSTCDLSAELVSKYDIGIIPLYVIKGKQVLRDGVDITKEDVFRHYEQSKSLCSTSALNVEDYLEFFGGWLKDYDAVVHINLSSELSSCYANAVAAAEKLGNVYPVDSLNLSNGSGHLAVDAALLAAEGMNGEEIQKILNERREKLEVSFILDTLVYLAKGGRCSSVAALGANILKLKPCIEVKDGKMSVGKKYRGPLDKVLVQYVRERLNGRNDIDKKRIFLCSTGLPEDVLQKIKDEVKANIEFIETHISEAGCTIASHCGPRCFGILFYRK